MNYSYVAIVIKLEYNKEHHFSNHILFEFLMYAMKQMEVGWLEINIICGFF